MTYFTWYIDIWQEMHLNLDDSISGTGFTSSTFLVETESSFVIAFCLCIFCSFVWGQVFAISCLVAVSFTEFPSPFLCYAMLIRCRAMSPAGFDERAGLLFYLIFAGIVCFIGMFLFLQLDLFPGLQRRPQ